MNNKKEIFLYEKSDGTEVYGTIEDYWEMKGYPSESAEPEKQKKKKKSFWQF